MQQPVFKHLCRPLLIPLCLLALRGIASAAPLAPSAFAQERPRFDLVQFFTGHTRSWGVLENGDGAPTDRICTETWGRVVQGELRLEQDLYIGHKPRSHRSWRIRRIDSHHFEATANDVIGTAHGVASGNAFFWSFTLALKPGNPLYNVRMTQHMYLQPDGVTMINRDSVRKFGLPIAGVTEQFHHL